MFVRGQASKCELAELQLGFSIIAEVDEQEYVYQKFASLSFQLIGQERLHF